MFAPCEEPRLICRKCHLGSKHLITEQVFVKLITARSLHFLIAKSINFLVKGRKTEIRLAETLPFIVAAAGSQTHGRGGSWERPRHPRAEMLRHSGSLRLSRHLRVAQKPGGASSCTAVDQLRCTVPSGGKKWPNTNAFSPRTPGSFLICVYFLEQIQVHGGMSACSLQSPWAWT